MLTSRYRWIGSNSIFELDYEKRGFQGPPATLSRRAGSASNFFVLVIASVAVVVGLGYLALRLRPDAQRDTRDETVRVYCASGVAKPVEVVIAEYNRRFDAAVELVRTGGSGELAGQLKTEFKTDFQGGADLYVTADDQLLDKAHAESIIAERIGLAEQRPVIAVAAGGHYRWADVQQMLQEKDLRFGIASPRAAVGRLARQVADQQGVLSQLESRRATESENVMTLAQALVTGSLDAAIIWDTTVSQINDTAEDAVLEIAGPIDPTGTATSRIAIGVVGSTQVPTAGLRFARFLASPEMGQPAFEKFGFRFTPGDPWEEMAEVHLYCGSMFTPVLEDVVREFARREGVNVYPRWEGCGKLVASMKTINSPELFPDGYLACDVSFLKDVETHFELPTIVSHNEIVLAVQKSVAARIDRPSRLVGTKLKVGICDPDLSALGKLTRRILMETPVEESSTSVNLYQAIQPQAAVIADVGPTLISQLLAGGLDAAFVYRSNVMADDSAVKSLRVYALNSSGDSKASQPWAISKTTSHRQLMHRLFERMSQPEIRARFEKLGFETVE